MTYDRARIVRREGQLTAAAVADLDRAIAMHLGLEST